MKQSIEPSEIFLRVSILEKKEKLHRRRKR